LNTDQSVEAAAQQETTEASTQGYGGRIRKFSHINEEE